ncbi:YtxH domain-containing protein [Patescibacteria group bacterium]|nr:YtxH domain-containing protein [Patescibacteria group bacterium]
MAKKTSTSGSRLTEIGSVVLGATVGVALGMLLTPRSGRQNRALLAKEGRKAVKAAGKVMKSAKSNLKKKAV